MKQSKAATIKRVSGRLKKFWKGQNPAFGGQAEMVRLLVVDGEQAICRSMKEYFSLQHYEVDTAQDLVEAERLVEAGNYDVIIQDLRLGPTQKPDGLEMVKFARAHNLRTRIVVLTAYGSPEMEKEAFRFGADAFLHKPKPLSHVAQVIQGLIEAPRSKQAGHSV
jgi:DNA-binding response OmpR family regulator